MSGGCAAESHHQGDTEESGWYSSCDCCGKGSCTPPENGQVPPTHIPRARLAKQQDLDKPNAAKENVDRGNKEVEEDNLSCQGSSKLDWSVEMDSIPPQKSSKLERTLQCTMSWSVTNSIKSNFDNSVVTTSLRVHKSVGVTE